MADPTTNLPTAEDELVPIAPERAQPGLPSPADMIKAEQPNPAPETPAVETPEKAEPTEEQLLVLKAKIEAGTELTEEEKKLAAEIDSQIETPKDEPKPSYKINGQEFSFDEMKSKMREYHKLDPTVTLNPESEKIMVESYAKIANQTEANKSIDRGFKDNAAERQRIAMERVRLEQVAQNLAQQQRRLESARKRQDAILSKRITEDEIYNGEGRVDPEKLSQYSEQRTAIQEAPELDREIKEVEQSLRETQTSLDLATLNEFVYAHPEYRTTEPINVVAQKIVNNDPTVDPEDEIKVREMNEFLLTSNPAHGVTVEKNYQFNLRRGSLAVKPPVQTGEMPNKTQVPTLPKPQSMLQKVELFRQNMLRKTPGGKGSGAPNHQPAPTKAREMVNHAHGVLGINTTDPFLKEFNY